MKKTLAVSAAALTVLSLAFTGCKARTEKMPDEMKTEAAESSEMMQEGQTASIAEPAQNVAVETIPPTAAPQQKALHGIEPARQAEIDRAKDIQRALKNAGFYTGSIDGKIGPRTKTAIQEFQRAKGLKIDGKVGPKTWAELEKYLAQS